MRQVGGDESRDKIGEQRCKWGHMSQDKRWVSER